MKCIQQKLHESRSEEEFGGKGVCFLFIGRKRVVNGILFRFCAWLEIADLILLIEKFINVGSYGPSLTGVLITFCVKVLKEFGGWGKLLVLASDDHLNVKIKCIQKGRRWGVHI